MHREEIQKSPSSRRHHRHCTPSLDIEWGRGSHTSPEVCCHKRKERFVKDIPVQEKKRNPTSARIMDSRIPRSLEKPMKLQSYDGTGDHDEHGEQVDDLMDYYHTHGAVKCKLFAKI